MNTFRNIIVVLFIVITILFLFSSSSPFTDVDKGNVLVLTYHLISENIAETSDFCVTAQMFEKDLIYLKSQGYEFLTASQLASTTARNRKIAVITFDDGYKSDLEFVVPLLEKYDACATFFIYGQAVGTEGYLTKEDVYALSVKKCAEVGNHSYSLHGYGYETLLQTYSGGKDKEIIGDFKKNDVFLSEITGKSPTALSYPNGVYSESVDNILKNDGKVITFSTEETYYKQNLTPVGRRNRSAFRNIADIEHISLFETDD